MTSHEFRYLEGQIIELREEIKKIEAKQFNDFKHILTIIAEKLKESK